VPILDGTGFLVERRIVCLAMGRLGPSDAARFARSAAVHDWLARHLSKRLARMQRHAANVAAACARVDRAIMRHLVSVDWPAELQVGLFDRREERAFLAVRDELADIEQATAVRLRQGQAAAELDVGLPSVELVFWPESCPSDRRQ
jgi:hypothetical protein